MEFTVAHELPGRLRIKLAGPVPEADIDALHRVVMSCPDVQKATIYPRIGSLAVEHARTTGSRERVLRHLGGIDAEAIDCARMGRSAQQAGRSGSLLVSLADLAASFLVKRFLLPQGLSTALTLWHYRTFLAAGLRSLLNGRLDVPVLDAAAIAMSFLKGDPRTAGTTMLLLDVGEVMEDYTRSRSEVALIDALLGLPETAQLVRGDQETEVLASELAVGDLVAVRTGMAVCADGVVERGEAMVNQASLTGESLAVERTVGDDVFAGTVVEDGEIILRVGSVAAETKLRSIVSMVEQAESLKSERQSRMERLADGIVPWNFLLAGVVALVSRDLVKTSAALMVDYSCALKLTSSIAVLSAMSQSARIGFTVKGSKHFEAMAQADAIVFDKTGTLTEATPEVSFVLAFDGWNRTQVLRFSACLEEHFPHPVARAVVRAAAAKNLRHRERHAEVEYIVAHGIASSLEGKRVVIGSEHFVTEDEGIPISAAQRAAIDACVGDSSVLFLAVDGRLVGAIGIHDPLKAGAADAVLALRDLGFERIVMLTGDGPRTAAHIASAAGVAEFHANLLPQDKYAFIDQLKAEGHRVVMVGDGVNDAPALSRADVGIAMGQGTAVAKEVADVTLTGGDLGSVVALRRMSIGLSRRMSQSFSVTMLVNTLLLALGIGGAIAPQTSSLLHNTTTVLLGLRNSAEYEA